MLPRMTLSLATEAMAIGANKSTSDAFTSSHSDLWLMLGVFPSRNIFYFAKHMHNGFQLEGDLGHNGNGQAQTGGRPAGECTVQTILPALVTLMSALLFFCSASTSLIVSWEEVTLNWTPH